MDRPLEYRCSERARGGTGPALSRCGYDAPVNIEPTGRRVTYLLCQYEHAAKKNKRKKNQAQMTARGERASERADIFPALAAGC